VSELSTDRSLFARLLIITRSQRDLNCEDILGKYEMSSVPRSMFAYDGTMNMCTSKSKLVAILTSLNDNSPDECHAITSTQTELPQLCVAVIDGMAEVQALAKTADIITCNDLSRVFISKMQNKYWKYDEVHFIFDSYHECSIKSLTRSRRLHGDNASQYKISDNTNIANVSLKNLLSHIRTKDSLTEYLANKLLRHAQQMGKNIVVAWRAKAAATHFEADYLSSTQEEADTKIILHAINAKERGKTSLLIFAQDTDVLVLAVRRYPRLPENTYFVPHLDNKISIKGIYMSLGSMKASALPGFHALSGCDTTGALAGKGKLSYWKAFVSSNNELFQALALLGTTETVTEDICSEIESFICRVYHLNTNIKTLTKLRWWMFTSKQTLGEKLPPTKGSLLPAILRANLQAMVWAQDDQCTPTLPSPVDHGWSMENGHLTPVLCDLPCAPDSVLKLIKCSCTKSRCSAPCKCRAGELPCTEMCGCRGDETSCDNVYLCKDDDEDISDIDDFEIND
jgi:hypothetical protein